MQNSVEIPLVMTPQATSRSPMYQPFEQPSRGGNNNRYAAARKVDSYGMYPRPIPYGNRMEESQIEQQTWPLLEMIPFTRFTYVNDPMTSEESRVTQWHWMPKTPIADFIPYQQVSRISANDWNL